MDTIISENQLQGKSILHQNQKAENLQRIPFKPLRHRLLVEYYKQQQARKKRAIGIRCDLSASSMRQVSVKSLNKTRAVRTLCPELPADEVSSFDLPSRDILNKFAAFSTLQKLKLQYDIIRPAVSRKTYQNISNGLKRVPRLKDLELKIKSSLVLSGDEFEVFAQTLKRMSQLERITLEFGGDYWLTDKVFNYLSKSFQRLASLKTLNLSFSDGTISDQAMYFLSQHMKKYSALENFSMLLVKSTQITNLGLEYLGNGFANATNLKNIKLKFRGSDIISEIGVEKLFEGIQKLEKIERIWVNFRGCDRIRDAGLQGLGEKLKGLKALKRLTIKFRGCDKLTDQGVSGLMKGVRTLSGGCLENVTLVFTSCRKITDAGLREIWEGLLAVSSLKNVQLSLKSCKSITEAEINNMIDDLKKVHPEMKLTIIAENIQIWHGVCL